MYCIPHGIGVVSVIFNLLHQKFLFGEANFRFYFLAEALVARPSHWFVHTCAARHFVAIRW